MSNFANLPEAQARSLTFLRGVRDAIAESIAYEASNFIGEEAFELVDEFVTYKSSHGAPNRLIGIFQGRGNLQSYVDDVYVLKKLVLRVARLERERCGYPLRAEMMDA